MIPKDRNGTEVVDQARVRRGDQEGVVIDTDAGAGKYVTLIGVMWDGANRVEFLPSRAVRVVRREEVEQGVG